MADDVSNPTAGSNQLWDSDLLFPEGLVGCPQLIHFHLESLSEFLPVARLVSQDVEGLSFIVADPRLWEPAYSCDQVRLASQESADIPETALVLAIVSLSEVPAESSVNLLGPILIDFERGEGFQGIQSGTNYQARHPLGEHLEIWHFEEGMIGCPDWRDFLMLKVEQDGSLGMLISLDQPFAALPIMDPERVLPGYMPELHDEDYAALGATGITDLDVYAVVNVPGNVEDSSVNLLGPLAIRRESGMARQVLLANSGYEVAYPISTGEMR